MKQLVIVVSILIVLGANSCTYHSEEELYGQNDCDTTNITYSDHIAPIIKNSCAISGCHVMGIQFPNLEDFSTIQSMRNSIKSRTQDRSMPKGLSLTDCEIEWIARWVDDGAPDN